MKAVASYLLLLAGILTSAIALAQDKKKDEPAATKPRGKFTISKETTYVTGPVRKDGYIDYAAALNERLKQGVTPENNANVLLWKAIGPHPEGVTMPPEFFRLMGIEALPEKGDYFVPLHRYLKDDLKIDVVEKSEQINAEESDSLRSPWKSNELPNITSWLKANEKPLDLVVEAAKRSQYFSPLVTANSDKERFKFSFLLNGVQANRSLGNALRARAMLRMGEGNNAGAWQDLLACHRLGRLVARGGTMIEGLVGVALDIVASDGDLVFLFHTRPDAEQSKTCLRDLRGLAPLPSVAAKVDFGERLVLLSSIVGFDQSWVDSLGGQIGNIPNEDKEAMRKSLAGIDWDPALRNVNRWYDRLGVAVREGNRTSRLKQLQKIETDLEERVKRLKEAGGLWRALDAKSGINGEVIGDFMMALMAPSVSKVSSADDRAEQLRRNELIAFALAWYRADHGQYPKDLNVLEPKYLPQVPQDVFAGKPLIYRLTDKGYLLYSIGKNETDDGGRGPDDEPPGDDISVRIPPRGK